MNVIDSYNQIMKDSYFRHDAVEDLLLKIKKRSTLREFSDETLRKIGDVLTSYEVEDGVTVFFPSSKPKEKELIAKIDIGKEFVLLWWGENLNRANSPYPNKYALGITFMNKSEHELAYYTQADLAKEFPDFADFFSRLEKGDTFKIFCYAKAGLFSKAVEGKAGEWLLQTPKNGKSFVPNRSIGMKVGQDEIHLFQVNNHIRTQRNVRSIAIV